MKPDDLRVYDRVLPPEWLLRLRAGVLRLERRTAAIHWVPCEKPVENVVEAVIDALRRALAIPDWLVGVEWWVRRAHPREPKTFHFDKDEALWASEGRTVHPRLASVLYLGSSGGFTLITDQRSADGTGRPHPPQPRERLVVRPEENRYLVFDGGLWHGVLPARDGDDERVTLLVNWWDREVSDVAERRPADLPRATARFALPPLRPAESGARRAVVGEHTRPHVPEAP